MKGNKNKKFFDISKPLLLEMPSNLTKKRGPLVLMLIAIIILVVMIGQIMEANQNFDNDTLNGTYSGTFSIDDHPMYEAHMTFDGFGTVNGSIEMETNQTFTGTYHVQGTDFSINYLIGDLYFIHYGTVQNNGELITGEIKLRYDDETYFNGTFFMPIDK